MSALFIPIEYVDICCQPNLVSNGSSYYQGEPACSEHSLLKIESCLAKPRVAALRNLQEQIEANAPDEPCDLVAGVLHPHDLSEDQVHGQQVSAQFQCTLSLHEPSVDP